MAQIVKSLPAVQETWVRSLGREDPLEKGMATHSSILMWRIPWTEEPDRLQPIGLQRFAHDWSTNTLYFYFQNNSHRKDYTNGLFIDKENKCPFY